MLFAAFVAIAGFIKFNLLDVPFVGAPVVYVSHSGERVTVHHKADGTVEVIMTGDEGKKPNTFIANPVLSASGTRYKSDDGLFEFWSKGRLASIFNKSKGVIFSGVEDNNAATPGQWFSGRLVFTHEAQTFHVCRENRVFWVLDPGGKLADEYEALTAAAKPYTEVYAELFGSITPNNADIDGFAQEFAQSFTVTEIAHVAPLRQHPNCRAEDAIKAVYFDPATKKWKNRMDPCESCIPENGFGLDGQLEGALTVVWKEHFFTLKNDLGENPDVEEVMKLFAEQYSVDASLFATHVELNNGVYRVIVPVESENIDFMSYAGALRATYDVAEVQSK